MVPAIVTAGRAVAPRVAAWVSTAEIGALSKLKSFLAAHPATASTFASLGITGIVDAALGGDTDSISALNDFASNVGIGDVDGGTVLSKARDLTEKVGDMIGWSNSSTDITDADVAKSEFGKQMVEFIRGNISTNPTRVLDYHRQLAEFMAMDRESLSNLMKAYM